MISAKVGRLAALASASILTACGGGGSSPSASVLTTLVISITKDTMRVGDAALARAEARDQSGAPMRTPEPIWTSSDPAVASVSHVGYVNALAIGTTRISAATLGKSAELTVHIVPTPVAGVLLSPTSAVLAPGESTRLQATPVDAAGGLLSGRPVSWLSSDTAVVQVTADGEVIAVGPGVTFVSAISEGTYASARIRVSGPAGPVAKVTLVPEALSFSLGETQQFDVTLEDAEGDLANGRAVVWASSAPNVATVSADGLVRAVAAGSAVIDAVSEGVHGTASVVVLDPADAIVVRVGDPVPNEIVGDTLRVVASASARNQIASVQARVFNHEIDLEYLPLPSGRGFAWMGTLFLTDVHYGPYDLVVRAVDIRGNVGVLAVPITRGAREGKGGTRLPPRNR